MIIVGGGPSRRLGREQDAFAEQVEVEVRETRPAGRDGYEFAVLGAHDADIGALIEQVTAIARTEIGHGYLRRHRDLDRWSLAGNRWPGG